MNFLDVKTDYAFKKVFGSDKSKHVLISFLNSMIDFEDGAKVQDLTIVNPYQAPLLKGMKDTYVDVKAVLDSGATVIIEMQVLNVEGFEKRVLYNAAKSYSTQLKKAEAYAKIDPVIALTITDFTMFEDEVLKDKVISYFKLLEKEHYIEYSNDVELVFVELPKFTKTEEELETIEDKWIYFLQNAGSLEYIPHKMEAQPEIVEAFDIANTAGMSTEELENQQQRHDFILLQKGATEKAKVDGLKQGRSEGKAEGKAEGRAERDIEIARSLKASGVDIQAIITSTKLSAKEIEAL